MMTARCTFRFALGDDERQRVQCVLPADHPGPCRHPAVLGACPAETSLEFFARLRAERPHDPL
jgi:hypothetical protein